MRDFGLGSKAEIRSKLEEHGFVFSEEEYRDSSFEYLQELLINTMAMDAIDSYEQQRLFG